MIATEFKGHVANAGLGAPYDHYVLVTLEPDNPPQLILIVDEDGNPQPYSGKTRRAALELVLGREVTEAEVIQHTRVGYLDGVALLKEN